MDSGGGESSGRVTRGCAPRGRERLNVSRTLPVYPLPTTHYPLSTIHYASLRLGTRASALAQWQAQWVAAQLRERGVEVELVPITTTGDRQHGPIGAIGGQGVFTKEIQRALLDGRIDLAVHSLKDLPTGTTPGLALAAVPDAGRWPTCW